MKKNLLLVVVAMIIASGLTFGQTQHQYRPLPIYRYVNLTVDNQNVLDSAAAVLPGDTVSLPYPNCPALVWGGWDTAHIAGPYNFTLSYYATGGYYEFKANGYKTGTGNLLTDQWYISPYFSTKQYTGVTFSFVSKCAKYAGPLMTAMISANFRNEIVDPAQWDTLSSAIIPAPNGTASSPWTHSGGLSLDPYQGDSVCIAFRYTSNTGAAATYYLDSIQITGTKVVGIKNINTTQKVSIYPNPVSNNLIISNMAGVNVVKISDILGETIQNINVSGNTANINVSNLSKGIYFISFMNEKSILETKKFVKE